MKTLHFFVEEESLKYVIESLMPQISQSSLCYKVHIHQGKCDLEQALRTTLPKISKLQDVAIMVVQDQDRRNCKELKLELKNIISEKTLSPYLIRIVCRELEAWYLGDLEAVKLAYPRTKIEKYLQKAEFRDVDSTQEPDKKLLSIIPEYKDYKSLPKMAVSSKIAPFLDINRNTSSSFHCFIKGIQKLLNS